MTHDRSKRATGMINVTSYVPLPYDQNGGPDLVEVKVSETFSGDLSGQGTVRFLQTMNADGSASFVGVERFVGTLDDRKGSFVLQDQGTVSGGVVEGEWFVVPNSATGELEGLRGEGGFKANLGQSAEIWLDYRFDAPGLA